MLPHGTPAAAEPATPVAHACDEGSAPSAGTTRRRARRRTRPLALTRRAIRRRVIKGFLHDPPRRGGGGDAAQLDRPAWKRSVTQLMVSEGTHGSSERRIVRIVDAQGPERVRKHRQAARGLVVLLVVAIV